MLRCVDEVLIGAEKNKVMPDAELRNQRIDRADLDTRPAACVSDASRSNMVFSVRLNQCQRREPLHDLITCFRTREALKKFLQHKTGGDHNVCATKCVLQCQYRWLFNLDVTSEGKRPDARIDQERHLRDRSAL